MSKILKSTDNEIFDLYLKKMSYKFKKEAGSITADAAKTMFSWIAPGGEAATSAIALINSKGKDALADTIEWAVKNGKATKEQISEMTGFSMDQINALLGNFDDISDEVVGPAASVVKNTVPVAELSSAPSKLKTKPKGRSTANKVPAAEQATSPFKSPTEVPNKVPAAEQADSPFKMPAVTPDANKAAPKGFSPESIGQFASIIVGNPPKPSIFLASIANGTKLSTLTDEEISSGVKYLSANLFKSSGAYFKGIRDLLPKILSLPVDELSLVQESFSLLNSAIKKELSALEIAKSSIKKSHLFKKIDTRAISVFFSKSEATLKSIDDKLISIGGTPKVFDEVIGMPPRTSPSAVRPAASAAEQAIEEAVVNVPTPAVKPVAEITDEIIEDSSEAAAQVATNQNIRNPKIPAAEQVATSVGPTKDKKSPFSAIPPRITPSAPREPKVIIGPSGLSSEIINKNIAEAGIDATSDPVSVSAANNAAELVENAAYLRQVADEAAAEAPLEARIIKINADKMDAEASKITESIQNPEVQSALGSSVGSIIEKSRRHASENMADYVSSAKKQSNEPPASNTPDMSAPRPAQPGDNKTPGKSKSPLDPDAQKKLDEQIYIDREIARARDRIGKELNPKRSFLMEILYKNSGKVLGVAGAGVASAAGLAFTGITGVASIGLSAIGFVLLIGAVGTGGSMLWSRYYASNEEKASKSIASMASSQYSVVTALRSLKFKPGSDGENKTKSLISAIIKAYRSLESIKLESIKDIRSLDQKTFLAMAQSLDEMESAARDYLQNHKIIRQDLIGDYGFLEALGLLNNLLDETAEFKKHIYEAISSEGNSATTRGKQSDTSGLAIPEAEGVEAKPKAAPSNSAAVIDVLGVPVDVSGYSPGFRSAAPRILRKVIQSPEGLSFVDPDNVWGGFLPRRGDMSSNYLEAMLYLYRAKIFSRSDLRKFIRDNIPKVGRKRFSEWKNALKHYRGNVGDYTDGQPGRKSAREANIYALNSLIKLADELDSSGLSELSDLVDRAIKDVI